MFQESHKTRSSVKKMFCWIGLSKPSELNKPIKGMNKEDEFRCIMNWVIHKMPKGESVTIRFEVLDQAYQVKIGHDRQRLYVYKPILMSTTTKPTLYDWEGEETYHTLTADRIRNSIQKADQMNRPKKQEWEQEPKKIFKPEEDQDIIELLTSVKPEWNEI